MPDTPATHQNHLLAAFPDDAQRRLFPSLERIDLALGKALYETEDASRYVYFPADAVLSLVTRSGASIEISVVGSEGLVGVSLLIGGEVMGHSQAVVQCAGSAYRLKGELLRSEFERNFRLMVLLLHYTRYRLVEVAQPTLCRRRHSIDQQLCHWLLLSMDRVPGPRLPMPQHLIANMLGVHRRGITEATSRLRDEGVIAYERGQITVLDRPRLEQLSCACHAAIVSQRRAARADLLPYLPPHLARLLRDDVKAA